MRLHSEAKLSLVAYLLIGVPALVLFSVVTPQFHVPDEPQHFTRAYQVSNFDFFPTKRPSGSGAGYRVGGLVDTGIKKVNDTITSIAFDDEKKLTQEILESAGRIGWRGERWQHTPNVSIYPPFFYIPAAIGIAVGKANELTIIETVTVSRWCNILTGVCLASFAILLSGECAVLLTGFLLLPMVLSQMASVSQDALMMPFAALLAAILTRMFSPLSSSRLIIFCILSALAIVLLSTTRPPYSALGLLFFCLVPLQDSGKKRKILVATALCSIGCSFLWAFYVSAFVAVPFGEQHVDYGGQIAFILSQPLQFMEVLGRSIYEFDGVWRDQMIGVLGWLDTPLPGWFYEFAGVSLVLLVFSFLLQHRKNLVIGRVLPVKFTILIVLGITGIGLLTVLYIVWSPVAADIVHGFQGRYLLPLLFLSILLFKPIGGGDMDTFSTLRLALLCLLGITGTTVGITSVFLRFYV